MKEVAFVSEKIIKTIKRENAYAVSKNPQQLEIIILHPSSFIILHSSFLHFAAFKLFSLFKKRGIGPTICPNALTHTHTHTLVENFRPFF